MKVQTPHEKLASLQDSIRKLELDEIRLGLSSSHAELKRLLQRRVVELELAAAPPAS